MVSNGDSKGKANVGSKGTSKAMQWSVMMALEHLAGMGGNVARSSFPELVELTCFTEQSVRRAIKDLEACGCLEPQPEGSFRNRTFKIKTHSPAFKIASEAEWLETLGEPEAPAPSTQVDPTLPKLRPLNGPANDDDIPWTRATAYQWWIDMKDPLPLKRLMGGKS